MTGDLSKMRCPGERRGSLERQPTDPSPEEIWGPGGLTEQIRAGWSATEERSRRGIKSTDDESWKPPVVAVSQQTD